MLSIQILLYYLFLAVLVLHCCMGLSPVLATGGYSLVAMHKLLVSMASPAVEDGLEGRQASVVEVLRLWSTGSIVGTWA